MKANIPGGSHYRPETTCQPCPWGEDPLRLPQVGLSLADWFG